MIDSVIPCGSDWSRVFTVRNSAGAAYNLTGWTPVASLNIGGTEYACTCAIVSAAAGTISVTIAKAVTATLPPNCAGDLELVVTQGELRERVGVYTIRTEEQHA